MSNADNPIYPREKAFDEAAVCFRWDGNKKTYFESDHFSGKGLSKREYACIHCGVPKTGDPELDAIIAEGNRIQKAMIDLPKKPEVKVTYGSEGS